VFSLKKSASTLIDKAKKLNSNFSTPIKSLAKNSTTESSVSKSTNQNLTVSKQTPKSSNVYVQKNKASAFHDLHIKSHNNVSILYADIVNFTPLADKFEPPELVNILNKLFAKFDQKAKVNKFNH
jgi:class 3 adenylate cyclase